MTLPLMPNRPLIFLKKKKLIIIINKTRNSLCRSTYGIYCSSNSVSNTTYQNSNLLFIIYLFIYLLGESFNLWRLLLIIAFYYQTKISISFLCRRKLNSRSLIQQLETLSVELTGIHLYIFRVF